MPLHPETVKLMKAAYAGLVCEDCNAPAERLYRSETLCHRCWEARHTDNFQAEGYHNSIDPRPQDKRPRVKYV